MRLNRLVVLSSKITSSDAKCISVLEKEIPVISMLTERITTAISMVIDNPLMTRPATISNLASGVSR